MDEDHSDTGGAQLYSVLHPIMKEQWVPKFSNTGKKPIVFVNDKRGSKGKRRIQSADIDKDPPEFFNAPFGVSAQYVDSNSDPSNQGVDNRRTLQAETPFDGIIDFWKAWDELVTDWGVENWLKWFPPAPPKPGAAPAKPRSYTREEIEEKRLETGKKHPRYIVSDQREFGGSCLLSFKVNTPSHKDPTVVYELTRLPDGNWARREVDFWKTLFDSTGKPKTNFKFIPIIEISSINFNGGYGSTVVVTDLFILPDRKRPPCDLVCTKAKIIKIENDDDAPDDDATTNEPSQTVSATQVNVSPPIPVNLAAFPGE